MSEADWWVGGAKAGESLVIDSNDDFFKTGL